MSNSTLTHSPKLIFERKKEKKIEREKNQEIGPVVHAERERERDRKGQRTKGMALTLELANRPDLTSTRDRG